MRKIAITGGLAAGKSTVCRILREYGAYTVDADDIVHRLLSPNTSVGKRVIELLGPEIVTGNQIDRKKISEIVFSNPKQLSALEAILHPAVKQELSQLYNAIKSDPSYRFFVAEVPLLYEAKMEGDFDIVVAVVADEKIAEQRSSLPDAPQRPYASQRRARQLPSSIKASKAHYTIQNNSDLTALRSAIQNLVTNF